MNTYVASLGGCDFMYSAGNPNAVLELSDSYFGGTRPEMMRLSPAGYANTAIMVRPNDLYNTAYGYRYKVAGTNTSSQSRYLSAFHAELEFPIDDSYPYANQAQLFAAKATVTNHYIDGFFADVRSAVPEAQAFAFHSVASRILFDGTGMAFNMPMAKITTDVSAHTGATNRLLTGEAITTSALMISPLGAERTGLIISPGQAQANGLFIGPQQSLATANYDGFLACLQYSTFGSNMQASTDKPLLYIRKHNAPLNGRDHSGAFIRLEENISSTGAFLEAFKYDIFTNSSKLKFSVDKDGVVSIGQVVTDPGAIATVGRIYFLGNDLKIVTPNGQVKTVGLV